jgi:hypothetical protein
MRDAILAGAASINLKDFSHYYFGKRHVSIDVFMIYWIDLCIWHIRACVNIFLIGKSQLT